MSPGDGLEAPSRTVNEIEGHINETILLRELDWHLLPALTFLYLLSFLDRSNLANAHVEGLATDLRMMGDQYLTGLTLYFIGYALFEIPCNVIQHRLMLLHARQSSPTLLSI